MSPNRIICARANGNMESKDVEDWRVGTVRRWELAQKEHPSMKILGFTLSAIDYPDP